MDLLVRRVREDVDELHRRRCRTAAPAARRCAQVGADRAGKAVEHRHQQIELAGRLVLVQQPEPRAQLAEHVGVRPRFADRVDHRPRRGRC